MKKQLFSALFCSAVFALSGCRESSHEKLNDLFAHQETATEAPTATATPTPATQRTKIDELSGTLMAFDGSQILVRLKDRSVCSFPVDNASLECRQGMLAGSEIVIIYEGKCDLEHPETLNILKVADPVDSQELRVRTVAGQVTDMTLNTLSIQTSQGESLRFQTTGTEQFYSQGVQKGTSVYIHFQGKFYKDGQGQLDTRNVKVLDISDLETIPEPTPTPTPDPSLEDKEQIKYLTGTILNCKNYTLRLQPTGSSKPLKIPLKNLTARFSYGIHEGSRATISYTGTIDGTNLKEAQILSIVGDDLSILPQSQQTATCTGTGQASTGSTIAVLTEEQTFVTCDISVTEQKASDLPPGTSVSITYNPIQAATTAIYPVLELQILTTV